MRVWSAEDKRFARARFDTSRLPPGVWFVRSARGSGYFPVTREGNRVMLVFMGVSVAGAVLGGVIAYFVPGIWWVAAPVVAIGGSAAWFIRIARRHGDLSINYADILVRDS